LTAGSLGDLLEPTRTKGYESDEKTVRMTAIRPRIIAAGGVAVCVLGAASATSSLPTSAAPSPCTAAGLATAASGVLNEAGAYLDSHPGANDVLTAAAGQSPEDARASVRGYFLAHPNEALDLQGIARPVTDLRNQCNVSVTPSQLAMLYEAVSR
jgi:hemophore-related protein